MVSLVRSVSLRGQINWDRHGRRWQQPVPIDLSPERVTEARNLQFEEGIRDLKHEDMWVVVLVAD